MKNSVDDKRRYLVDASAFYPLIRRLKLRIIDILEDLAILDLTLYEIGNTVWKEYRRKLVGNPYKIIDMFTRITEHIEKIRIEPEWLNNILEIALNNNLTFYDASYIYVSRKYNLTLVTEDKDLLNIAENSIKAQQLVLKLGIEQ